MNRLKKRAERVCRWRGHDLGKWSDGMSTSVAECKICGAHVMVDIHPPPNGIEVGGNAVAVGCKVSMHSLAASIAEGLNTGN
jgi:hypothetical protein